jgi:hypothetical protein
MTNICDWTLGENKPNHQSSAEKPQYAERLWNNSSRSIHEKMRFEKTKPIFLTLKTT